MAVKIRLMRMGKKKQPTYRMVIADSRSPRDGRFIESIGRYDPRQEPSLVEVDNDRAVHWLQTGAQPTERAQKLLEISGAWARFKIARGEVYTVPSTPVAKVVEEAPAEAAAAVEEAAPEEAASEEAASEEAASEEAASEEAASEEAASEEREAAAAAPDEGVPAAGDDAEEGDA